MRVRKFDLSLRSLRARIPRRRWDSADSDYFGSRIRPNCVIAVRRNKHLGDGPELPRYNDWFALDLREVRRQLHVALGKSELDGRPRLPLSRQASLTRMTFVPGGSKGVVAAAAITKGRMVPQGGNGRTEQRPPLFDSARQRMLRWQILHCKRPRAQAGFAPFVPHFA